ncbi:MAG: uroporphyrinogen-III synthase [Gammaproteobacteria bacterium]|nr:uroporphyrinogen-III synthase [Gammaproteobacteria bacterium]
MNRTLDGVTVVVTRPAAQSARFIELATAAGATCLAYPTLLIEPLALAPETLAQLQQRRWDWAVFTSTNAVSLALANVARPLAAKNAAVGRATARALEQAGVTVDARPENATSEGLLALPEFAQMTGRSVLLVKGAGGRDLLPTELRIRGAAVLELEVYRRVVSEPTAAAAAALHDALGSGRPVIVTVTSAEILRALLDGVASADAARLREQPLVVPGSRVALEALRQGWTGPLTHAATAEDEAMISALARAAATGPPPAA